MEEQVKIIEIPNFITIKIVKINEAYSASYVTKFSSNHFYANEFDQILPQLKFPMPYSLCFEDPVIIKNCDLEDLKDKIYKLHKELTQIEIPRAKIGQAYYSISDTFGVWKNTELNCECDNKNYNTSNYFVDKNLAERFANKLQDYLIKLWKEEREQNNA